MKGTLGVNTVSRLSLKQIRRLIKEVNLSERQNGFRGRGSGITRLQGFYS